MNAFTSEEAEKRVNAGHGGYGIHSGVKRLGDRRNSPGVASQAKRDRVRAALTRHLQRHPNDKQSATHLASLA